MKSGPMSRTKHSSEPCQSASDALLGRESMRVTGPGANSPRITLRNHSLQRSRQSSVTTPPWSANASSCPPGSIILGSMLARLGRGAFVEQSEHTRSAFTWSDTDFERRLAPERTSSYIFHKNKGPRSASRGILATFGHQDPIQSSHIHRIPRQIRMSA